MIGQLCALVLAGGLIPPTVSEDQAYFAILAETKIGRMAGMPPIDLGDLPPGFKLPPEAMMFAGKPTRILNMRLWSQGLAPANASAFVTPPGGLKQGERLDLALYRPEPSATTGGKVRDFDPDSNPEFTIKIYWGSSETVKEGQPKIVKWAAMNEQDKEAMRQRAREARAGNSYFYRPNWTTGYWPTEKQPGNIGSDASLVGKYTLTTNYTGNVEIEAPSNVNFLDAIQLSAPSLDKKVDLKKHIGLQWPAIPNVLGQYATVMGMEGKNTMIFWLSSEVFADEMMGDLGFLQMAQVRDFVAKTIFMAPDRTSVNIPAGIFQNADFAMLNMAGYGHGSALEKAQPLPRIQTKTSLMVMLGGKKMDFAPRP